MVVDTSAVVLVLPRTSAILPSAIFPTASQVALDDTSTRRSIRSFLFGHIIRSVPYAT